MKTFLRRVSIAFGALVALLLLFHLVENWRGKRAWRQWREARMAVGDSGDIAPLLPPAIPDAENFAKAPRIAESLVTGIQDPEYRIPKLPTALTDSQAMGRWQNGRRTDLEKLKTELRIKNLEEILDPWETELAAVAEASHRPHCRLASDYTDPRAMPLFLGFRARARMLAFRALVSLHEKREERALADVLTGLRVASRLQKEPHLISQLARIAWLNILMQPIWEGLQDHRWKGTQLQELQQALATVDLVDSWPRALRFERIAMTKPLVSIAETPFWRRYRMMDVPENQETTGITKAFLMGTIQPEGWVYQKFLVADQWNVRVSESVFDPTRHRIWSKASREMQAALSTYGKYDFFQDLARNCTPVMIGQNARVARTQSMLDLAILACALERHRQEKGSYPATLEALVPSYLPGAPVDVVEGQPLKYAAGRNGFTLYSLGWNLTDEGGQGLQASEADPAPGDWVWSKIP